ncbi:MAG: TAT-variant-translocated molybdopterin oxidoreductase, partial [Pirellula sp.]
MSPIDSRNELTASVQPTNAPRPQHHHGYWRSVDHLSGSFDVGQCNADEFPNLPESIQGFDRRNFMRLVGASMALAGISNTGCRRWPMQEIRPHTSRPEGSMPGVAEFYATLFELQGVATGILAKSYDGRPVKIEGNPNCPIASGAASALAQASLLDLYDPDRSRRVIYRNGDHLDKASLETDSGKLPSLSSLSKNQDPNRHESSWEQFESYAKSLMAGHRTRQGEGFAILLEPSSSPTRRRLVAELQQSMPKMRLFTYQPLHNDHAWAASRAAFGKTLRCQFDLTRAKTIVCIDADLLGTHPAHLKHARD